MPKKLFTLELKNSIKRKLLQRLFGKNPSYTNVNDVPFYQENKNILDLDKTPYFVLSGPAVAPQSWTFLGMFEHDYPRIGFYTYMPGINPREGYEDLQLYANRSILYRWGKGEGFLNTKHDPEPTEPGNTNYPEIVQEFVDLSNMAGHPSYVGLSPELSKLLPELVIMPNQKYFIVRLQNGGTMKQLVSKHQKGNIVLDQTATKRAKGEVEIDPYTGRELQRELPKDPAKDHVVLYLTLPEKNFLKRHKGYIEFANEPEQKRVNFFKRGSTYFDKDQPVLALGFMQHSPIRDDHGQIIGWTPTTYGQSGQELERETTNMYINEYGDLPWWYEGSYRNSYELPEIIISKKQGGIMRRLIPKHLRGGWIRALGQEGVPTLKNLQYYGSYNNPIQLPELVVTGQERVPLSFDRREYGFPGGHAIITDALYDYYHRDDGTYTGDIYMGDNSPLRGGRVIYVNPDKQNDTIWVEPTPRVNDQAVLEKYGSKPNSYVEFLYLPEAENLNKAKLTFYKNVKKSKPGVGDKKEIQAWKRAKKGN